MNVTFDTELEKLREITTKLTENGYLIDRAAQWEFAFDAVPDYVFIVNPEYKIKYINKSMVDILGKGRAEVFNIDCCELIRVKGPDTCLCRMDAALKEPIVIEELYLEDGIKGWFHFTRSPIYDESEELLGVVGVLRDITDRKQTEEALEVSETKYSELYNTSPDMYVSVDAKTALIKQCNSTLLRKLGYTREEVIGEEIFKLYHEDCMEEVHESFNTFVRDGHLRGAELQLKKKDGRPIEVSLNVSAVRGKDGNILYSSSTWRDITIRKETEKALEERTNTLNNILVKAADGICVCHNISEEPHVKFTHWNPRMVEITGYTMEEINKLGWYQTMYPDPELRDCASKRMAEMREGVDIQAEEWEITTKNGNKKSLSISTSVVKKENETIYALAVMQDVTERKQKEDLIKSIFKASPTGIGFSIDRVIQWGNETLREMTGYSEEELYKADARLLYQDDEMYEWVGKTKYTQIKEVGVGSVETVWKRKDGRLIKILLSSAPMDQKDRSKGITFTATDITNYNNNE